MTHTMTHTHTHPLIPLVSRAAAAPQYLQAPVDEGSSACVSGFQMYVTCTVQAKGTRLAKPVVSLTLVCLAFLTGLNRVAEYRNHWADVIAGFVIGGAIATFLVRP